MAKILGLTLGDRQVAGDGRGCFALTARLLHALRPVGRHRHRLLPVRLRHGRLSSRSAVLRAWGRWVGMSAVCSPPCTPRFRPTTRRWPCCPTRTDAGCPRSRSSSCHRRAMVGRVVSRAPSRAAAATWPSGSCPRATSATRVLAALWFNIAHYALRPVAVDRGRARLDGAATRAWPTRNPATCGSWSTTCRPSGAGSSWRRSSPPTCRRSPPSSTGARPTSSTTCTGGSGR